MPLKFPLHRADTRTTMFTAVVTGIILFPWCLVVVPIIGWLVRRGRRASRRDARTRDDLQKAA